MRSRRLLSSRGNEQHQTIAYDDFSVTFSIGGLLYSNHRSIAFQIESTDGLLIWPDKLPVNFAGDTRYFKVYEDRKELGPGPIPITKKKQLIMFDVMTGVKTQAGDTISFYGPGIFQRDGKFYDLDTLVFVMKKPPAWYGG
jgi:hypothetical protein